MKETLCSDDFEHDSKQLSKRLRVLQIVDTLRRLMIVVVCGIFMHGNQCSASCFTGIALVIMGAIAERYFAQSERKGRKKKRIKKIHQN